MSPSLWKPLPLPLPILLGGQAELWPELPASYSKFPRLSISHKVCVRFHALSIRPAPLPFLFLKSCVVLPWVGYEFLPSPAQGSALDISVLWYLSWLTWWFHLHPDPSLRLAVCTRVRWQLNLRPRSSLRTFVFKQIESQFREFLSSPLWVSYVPLISFSHPHVEKKERISVDSALSCDFTVRLCTQNALKLQDVLSS